MTKTFNNLNDAFVEEINPSPEELTFDRENFEPALIQLQKLHADSPEFIETADVVDSKQGDTGATQRKGTNEAPPLQASPFPGLKGRPRYVVLEDWKKSIDGNHRPGVYYCGLATPYRAVPSAFETTASIWINAPLGSSKTPTTRQAGPAL